MGTTWCGFDTVSADIHNLHRALEYDSSLTHFCILSGNCVPIHSPDEFLGRMSMSTSYIYWKGMPQGNELFDGCTFLCHSKYMVLIRKHAESAVQLINSDNREACNFFENIKKVRASTPQWRIGCPEETVIGSWLFHVHPLSEFINSMSTFFRFPYKDASRPITLNWNNLPNINLLKRHSLFVRKCDKNSELCHYIRQHWKYGTRRAQIIDDLLFFAYQLQDNLA